MGAVFGVTAGCDGHFVWVISIRVVWCFSDCGLAPGCFGWGLVCLCSWWWVLLGLWFAVLVPLCRVVGGFAAFGFLVIVGGLDAF